VKPSECENYASRSKKASSSNMDFIREVKSLRYATVKKEINGGALQWHLQNFDLGFEHIRVLLWFVVPCIFKSSNKITNQMHTQL
jgi:hypothetical protein